MPVQSEAVKRFLEHRGPRVPDYKGASREWLLVDIRDSTGIEFEEHTKLRPHQLEGLAFALRYKRALLFYGMRLGKTLLALDWARHLFAAYRPAGKGLVIAHAPVGLDVWADEVRRHSSLKITCVRKDRDEFLDALDDDSDLICIPFSGLQVLFSERRLSRKGTPKHYADRKALRIVSPHFSLCVIDEIHMVKDPTSLRYAIVSEIAKCCYYRLGLTGTPVGRDGFAVWSQAMLADEGETLGYSYPFFQIAFGYKKKAWFAPGHELWAFDKKKLPILQDKIKGLALSYKFEEVRSVNTMEGTIELALRGEQRKAYRALIDEAIKQQQDTDLSRLRNRFMRLRQISSGFLPFEDDDGEGRVVTFPECAKLEWIADLLGRYDDQYVIFHEFTRSGEMICDLAKAAKRKFAWLYGGTKDPAGAIRDFQSGRAQILIANTAKGGMSVDLHKANYVCFYEPPVSPITAAQAKARPLAEARGDAPLIYDNLMCSPVERRILQFLAEGKDLSAALTGGKFRDFDDRG